MDFSQQVMATRQQNEKKEFAPTTQSMQGGMALESTFRDMSIDLDNIE